MLYLKNRAYEYVLTLNCNDPCLVQFFPCSIQMSRNVQEVFDFVKNNTAECEVELCSAYPAILFNALFFFHIFIAIDSVLSVAVLGNPY